MKKGLDKYIKLLVVLLLSVLVVGDAWATTDYANLNYSGSSTVPSGYTLSSTNSPAIASSSLSTGGSAINLSVGGASNFVDGSTLPTKRYMTFTIDENCSIEIKFYSTSTGRILHIIDGSTKKSLVSGTVTTKNSVQSISYDFTGITSSKTIYLAGLGSSNLYITNITLTSSGGGSCTNPTVTWSTTPADGTVGGSMTCAANTTGGTIAYTSSNTSVATVNSSTGAISYVGEGTATITATATDGTCTGTATQTITVSAGSCTAITPTLSYDDLTLTAGGSNSSEPLLTGNSGSGAVTYSSSNTSVATVNSSTGIVTPVAAGSVTITATVAATGSYCSGTATADFTIEAGACTAITPSISYSSTTLTVGGSASAAPTVDGNTGSAAVTYTSSNTSVATVDASGVVTPVAAGTATITATFAATGSYCSGTATATFTVEAGGIGCTTLASASVTSATTMSASVGEVTVSNPSSQSITSTAIKLNSSGYIQLKPKSGSSFAAGDVLTVIIYNSGSTNTRGFRLSSSSGTAHTTSVEGSKTATIEYTLTASDIESDGSVKIFRYDSNSFISTEVKIEHCVTCLYDITPTISYASTTLEKGSTSSTPTIDGNTGSGAVTYSSSNTDVATVSSTGVVTAVGKGTADITASIASSGDYCSADVVVSFTVTCNTPDAPTALAAGSLTTTGATLTITDAAGTNNYEIYYSTSSTAPTASTAATVTSTSKTKAITGLTASTTYYAWVRSVCDDTHKSAWTASSSFTTNASVPDIAVSYNSTNVASGSTLDLGTYDLGSDETTPSTVEKKIDVANKGTETLNISSFVISNTSGSAFSGSCDGTCPSVDADNTQQFALTIASGLAAGTYSGTVTINSDDPDESAYTFNITYTVVAKKAAAPTNLAVDCDGNATWTAVEGASSYNMQVCSETTTPKSYEFGTDTKYVNAIAMVDDADFFVEGKNYGMYKSTSPYSFILAVAKDSTSSSKAGSPAPLDKSQVDGYMIIKLTNPETLYLTVNEGSKRPFYFEYSTDDMATWSSKVKHSEATDVEIDINKIGTVYARISLAGSSWVRIQKISYTSMSSCTTTTGVASGDAISGLTEGTTYHVAVQAAGGEWSDAVEYTYPAAAVTSVTAVPSATSVALSWPASTGATGYVVTVNGNETTVTGTSATITGLTSNTSYTATVKAKTGTCLSAATSTSFTTLAQYTLTVNYVDKTGSAITGPTFTLGSTTSAGTATSESMTVGAGSQTVSINGSTNYGFDHWVLPDASTSTDEDLTLTVSGNTELTAVFSAKTCTDMNITTSTELTTFNTTGDLWESIGSTKLTTSNNMGYIAYGSEYLYTSKTFDEEVSSVSLTLSLKKLKTTSVDHYVRILMYDEDGTQLGSQTLTLNSLVEADCYTSTPAGHVFNVDMVSGTRKFAIEHPKQSCGSTDYNIYFWKFTYCLKEAVQKVTANITPTGTSEEVTVPVVVKMSPTVYYTEDACANKTTITAANASTNKTSLLGAIKIYKLNASNVYDDVTSSFTGAVTSGSEGDSITITYSHAADLDYETQYKVEIDNTKIVNGECTGITNNVRVFKTMVEPKPQISVSTTCGGTEIENGGRQSIGTLKSMGSLTKTFYIKNTGDKTLTLSSITSGNAAFTIESKSSSTVAPGKCETFVVKYTSQDNIETLTSPIKILSDDAYGNDTFDFTVTGATAGFVLPYTYQSGCTNPSASAAGLVQDYSDVSDRPDEITGGTLIPSLSIYSAIGGCSEDGKSAVEISDTDPLIINTGSTKAIGTITIGWASTGIRKMHITNNSGIAYAESDGWENANECHELTATINDCSVKGGAGTGYAEVHIEGLESGAKAYIYYIYITPCDPEKQSSECKLIDVKGDNVVDGSFETEGTDAFVTVTDCVDGNPSSTFTPTTLTISTGATISPKANVAQTLNAQGYVTYVVTAADGITKKTYHLYPECPVEFENGACYADSVKVDYLMYAEDKTIFVNGLVSAKDDGTVSCDMTVDPLSTGANYTIHYLSKEDKPLEGYKIEGPSQVCVGSTSTYKLANAPESNNPVYKWQIKHNDESGFSMVGDYNLETIGGVEYEVFTGSELKLKAPNVLDKSGTVSVSITIDLDFTDKLCAKLQGTASAEITATDKAPDPVTWIENGCATSNGRLSLTAHQIPESGVVPDKFIQATKFEWSFVTTPSTQKVTPVLSQDSSFVMSMGANAPAIRATVVASNGCGAADAYTTDLTYSASSSTWTGAVSDDWNNAGNWTKQVPSECTDVTIPMVTSKVDLPAGGQVTVANYPNIKAGESAVCDEITFLRGGAVLGLDRLSYRRAYVKNAYQRNIWYTLTNPLKEMYSGDYYFSGVPLTYLRKFDAVNTENGGTYTQTWTKEFTGLQVPLKSGEGFAYMATNVSMRRDTTADAGDQEVTFPRMTADSSLVEDLHKFNPLTGKLLSKTYTNAKTESAYRFAYDDASVSSTGTTPVASSFPSTITASLSTTGSYSLIGNPMMTHLDLAKFYETNKSVIGNTFVFWNGETNTSVEIAANGNVASATAKTDVMIAPMQGFFVKSSTTGGTVTFDLANHFAEDNSAAYQLRSADLAKDGVLYVTGTDGETTSYLSVWNVDGASNGFVAGEDAEKTFTAYAKNEIYTLASGVATDINMFSTLPCEIPLAVKTTQDKDTITLKFNNAESFGNIDVTLVNKFTGDEINLKDESKYKFGFTKEIAETALVLRFGSSEEIKTSDDNAVADADGCDIQIFTKGNNTVRVMSSSNNPIREVSIYDAAGKMISKEVATGDVNVMDRVLNGGARNVVVTAVTENCVKTEILQLK